MAGLLLRLAGIVLVVWACAIILLHAIAGRNVERIAESASAPMPIWITTLIPMVALIAAWIAWQQMWINQEKLRLDLFDKRYKIFEATRALVASIVRDGRVDFEVQRAFWRETAEATFLFRDDVTCYLDLLTKRSNDMHYHTVSQKPPYKDHAEHVDKESQLLLWFAAQLRDDGMARIFGRYLRFRDLFLARD